VSTKISRILCSSLNLYQTNVSTGRLGGVTGSVLAIGSKVRGYKLGRDDGFLGAIKIPSTPSFRVEVA
jgi:hypothetical protein